MVRYFFHISYIGTKYRGSQKFLDFPNETIQGVIEAALCSLNTANKPVTTFASRTDKGVHAFMNTFHADIEHKLQGEVYQPHILRNRLNSYLKENNHEISVTNACIVPESFHARYHVKWRSYLYRLAVLKPELRITFPDTPSCQEYLPVTLINRCHVVPSNINMHIVKEVMNLYRGQHDFSCFTKYTLRYPWKNTKRTIDEISLYELPLNYFFGDSQYSNITMWEFHLKSASFLYHQVRKLVGTAISAGFCRMSISDIESVLKYPTPEKLSKTYVAPACGLYLSNLHYDKEGFIGKEELEKRKESVVI